MSEEKLIPLSQRKIGDKFLIRKNNNPADKQDIWFEAEVIEIVGHYIVGYPETDLTITSDPKYHGCTYSTIRSFISNNVNLTEIQKKYKSFHKYELSQLAFDTKDIVQSVPSKGTQKMTTTAPQVALADMLKADAYSAMYRATASQITKATKATIVRLMEQQGQDSLKTKAISDLMETKAGDALVSVVIGMLLHYLPKISEDERAKKLSEEFRVNGMSIGIEAAMDLVIGNFLPMFQDAIASLPQEEKIRVSTPAEMMAPKEDVANIATTVKAVNG